MLLAHIYSFRRRINTYHQSVIRTMCHYYSDLAYLGRTTNFLTIPFQCTKGGTRHRKYALFLILTFLQLPSPSLFLSTLSVISFGFFPALHMYRYNIIGMDAVFTPFPLPFIRSAYITVCTSVALQFFPFLHPSPAYYMISFVHPFFSSSHSWLPSLWWIFS